MPDQPAPAKPSATIMLIRDAVAAEGVEVFMLKRHSGADFGDAYV